MAVEIANPNCEVTYFRFCPSFHFKKFLELVEAGRLAADDQGERHDEGRADDEGLAPAEFVGQPARPGEQGDRHGRGVQGEQAGPGPGLGRGEVEVGDEVEDEEGQEGGHGDAGQEAEEPQDRKSTL